MDAAISEAASLSLPIAAARTDCGQRQSGESLGA